MRFRKRASTTGKATVSDELKKEIALTSHYDTALVKTFKIPPSLVINLDQILSKFVPGNRSTQAAIGSETVTIAVSTDKKMIILTYCITLKGDFVPVQMIYGGKTSQSIPHMSFRSLFCICVNERHAGISGL